MTISIASTSLISCLQRPNTYTLILHETQNSFLSFLKLKLPSQKREHFVQNMTSERTAQVGQAREAFQQMYQISQLLNTGLDAESLSICIRLCELGVNPEVLAHVIKEIRKIGENAVQSKPANLQAN